VIIMAWVVKGGGDGFFGTVTLVDEFGKSVTKEYEMTAGDFATAETDILAIIAALEGVTRGNPVQYSIAIRYTELPHPGYPEGAQRWDKARIVGDLETAGKKATIEIPMPLEAIFQGTTGGDAEIVDLSDTEVTAYVNLFASGGEAFISDGEVFGAPIYGRRVSRSIGLRR
jgi:hypothetical protein